MRDLFNIPNLISFGRGLMVPCSFWLYLENHNAALFVALTILIIALDGLDGIVARKLNQATVFGAKIDIALDRVVELAYWYFFAYLGVLHIWVFWFFLVRGVTVDYLTRNEAKPLGMSFLRSSRFMRGAYGTLKLLSFALLILIPDYLIAGINLSQAISYLTVVVCALRALPVLMDCFAFGSQ